MKQNVRKIAAVFFLILLLCPAGAFAKQEETAIPEIEISQEMADAMEQGAPDFDFGRCIEQIQEGNFPFDAPWLLEKAANVFLGQLKTVLKIMAALLVIGVLFAVVKTLGPDEKQGGVFSVAYYICLLVLFGLIIAAFLTAAGSARQVIESVCVFLKSILMVLFAYLATAGSFVSAGAFSATFLVVVQIISDVVLNVLFPLSMITLALSFVNALYERPVLQSLISLLKSASKYILTFLFIVFLGMASLQGALSSTFESISTKGTKFVIKSIPVVGSLLSDSVDVVLSSSVVIKNAAGTAGIFALIVAVLVPILQLAATILIFKLGGALLEVIAGEKFSRCLSQSGDALSMVFGCVLCVFVFGIAAIGVVISVGNAALMR